MSLSAKRPSRTIKDELLTQVRSDHEKPKRLNAEVEASLYRRIKIQAATEERSISDITRHLWIEYLNNNSLE